MAHLGLSIISTISQFLPVHYNFDASAIKGDEMTDIHLGQER